MPKNQEVGFLRVRRGSERENRRRKYEAMGCGAEARARPSSRHFLGISFHCFSVDNCDATPYMSMLLLSNCELK